MNLRELWRVTNTIYREVSFQSIFLLRAGSGLPKGRSGNINRLIRNAQVNIIISKILTSIFIAVFGFTIFLSSAFGLADQAFSGELLLAGSVSAFLASVLFLILFMGLQVSTSFVQSKISDVLGPLPLSRRDISHVVFLCLVRIFDFPLATAVVALLAPYFLVGGTILGGIVAFSAIVITEVLALSLTIGMARFFYSRVASGTGRSRWRALFRSVYMIVWILPTFGIYLAVNFAVQIVEAFAALTQGFYSMQFIAAVFPFSFGFLVSSATSFSVMNYLTLGLSVVSSIAYGVIAVFCLRWVMDAVRRVGSGAVVSSVRDAVTDTIIKPQAPWLGIIRKDLRIASRSPSYASLFLLPVAQTVILAISFSSIGIFDMNTMFGVLFGMSLVSILVPPTLFSIEGLASAYTRSLPLRMNSLIFSKTVLSVSMYVVSLFVLSVVALYLGSDPVYVLSYGLAYSFSVATANMLELKLLAGKFWKEGFAMGNIYSRLSTFVLIGLPGFAVISLPMVMGFIAFFLASSMVLPVFFGVAVAEFVVMAGLVFRQK